jgi:phosphoribosylaminoimidazolecarboxamide formyltransferase/IMP cyclohydrolase
MATIRRALISVSDKTGVLGFARGLVEREVEILSTGGTAALLREHGVPVTPVEQVTGFPEMMDGRVKTLHPAVHGAILADRDVPAHMEALASIGGAPIDLVAVNLYPFEATVAREGVSLAEAIENIDIGGPAMIRSAAKNHAHVAVLTSPEQYSPILEELRHSGSLSATTRRSLALAAFAHTSAYDAAIAAYLSGIQVFRRSGVQEGQSGTSEHLNTRTPEYPNTLPDPLVISLPQSQVLRYGENPHQSAAFYREPGVSESCAGTARQLHGKELSFINLLDLDAALELVKEFERPAAAIIKHTNPCGCAVADTLTEAYRLARDSELPPFNPPGSRFGGIIALNRPLDLATAEEIVQPGSYYEVIVAPGFAPEALTLLQERKIWGPNVRLMEVDPLPPPAERERGPRGLARFDLKRVVGGLLVQERDLREPRVEELQVVTERRPTPEEMEDLLFAWKVVRHVKSNAIVLARGGQLIGLGAGQVNRAVPVELAVQMAGPRVEGAVLASDAYFPHADGPETAARAGVRAIIQPGGSKKDEDTIAVANRYGVAMVFTGYRHFRH